MSITLAFARRTNALREYETTLNQIAEAAEQANVAAALVLAALREQAQALRAQVGQEAPQPAPDADVAPAVAARMAAMERARPTAPAQPEEGIDPSLTGPELEAQALGVAAAQPEEIDTDHYGAAAAAASEAATLAPPPAPNGRKRSRAKRT